MPRPLWSGSISFGLVNVPVRMYSAVREHKLHFHFVHEKDSSPIGYQKVCKAEGKPVPDDEVVKAFEYTKGKYVFIRAGAGRGLQGDRRHRLRTRGGDRPDLLREDVLPRAG
jgi:Ku protein